jgi:RecA-family ATPase
MGNRIFHYSIHKQLINKDNPAKAALGWEPVSTSGEVMFALVTNDGHPFTSVFKDNHRKDSNWMKTSVIGLDFDGIESEQLSYEQAVNDEFISNNALFIYPSPSWAFDKQKYRVVFGVDTPIPDPIVFKKIVVGLMNKVKGADIQCKDTARFFWGCNIPKNVKPVYFGNTLKANVIGSISGSQQSTTIKKTEKEEKYISFFSGSMTDGEGRNAIVYQLAKDLAKGDFTMGSASSMVVALNAQQAEPLSEQELSTAFTNGWKKIRKDSEEEISITFEDAYTARQEQLQPLEVIVEGLMHKTGLAMIAGSPGVGKSLLAMNLALAIASDKEKFLHYNIERHGKVLWIDYEMTKSEFVSRLQKIPIEPKPDHFKFLLDAPNITDKKFLEVLSSIIEEEQPLLVVIDNITTSHGGDENAAKDVRNILRPLQLLAKQYDINFLLVHHFRKHVRFETLNLDMIVGSGTFARLLHSALLMHESSKDTSIRIVKAAKLRNWPQQWKQTFGIQLQDDLTFDYIGEVDEQEHLPSAFVNSKSGLDWSKFIKPGEELTRKELSDRIRKTGVDASAPTIDRWLKKALENGELRSPRHGVYQCSVSEDIKKSIQAVIEQGKERNLSS